MELVIIDAEKWNQCENLAYYRLKWRNNIHVANVLAVDYLALSFTSIGVGR